MHYPFILSDNPDKYDHLLSIRHPPGGWSPTFNLLDGIRRGDVWSPVPFERWPTRHPSYRKNRGKPVDFPSLMGLGLAFSERALEVLDPLVSQSIEALPLDCVNCGQDKFFVINVLDVVDCLDVPRCIYEEAHPGYFLWIDRYAFRPGSVEGHHIFKVPQQIVGSVLVSPEFKRRVEESGLVGAVFREVGRDADLARN
jgi:uncharacterized protein DUF1629